MQFSSTYPQKINVYISKFNVGMILIYKKRLLPFSAGWLFKLFTLLQQNSDIEPLLVASAISAAAELLPLLGFYLQDLQVGFSTFMVLKYLLYPVDVRESPQKMMYLNRVIFPERF